MARKERTLYWSFLAGALCLAGFPGSGGFFSKDAILAGLLQGDDPLRMPLLAVGLLTALLTSFYTFRMLLIVFHGEPAPASAGMSSKPLPRIMLLTLPPLALLALLGGVFNLPAYLAGQGFLSSFLATISGFGVRHHPTLSAELALQATAAATSLAGLVLAMMRYSGKRRSRNLAAEESGSPFSAFLLKGWYLDHLYRLILIRPFIFLSRLLWKGVDEAGIDGAVNGLAALAARLGQASSSWSTGRVSSSLAALAWGVAALLAYWAWVWA